jgi:hypothetical protein
MLDGIVDTASSPVFLTLVFIIGAIIQTTKQLVFGKEKLTEAEQQALTGWKRAFFVTRRLQALAIGALVGVGANLALGMEAPESYEMPGLAGAVLFCTLSGAIAQLGYTALIGAARDWLSTRSKA